MAHTLLKSLFTAAVLAVSMPAAADVEISPYLEGFSSSVSATSLPEGWSRIQDSFETKSVSYASSSSGKEGYAFGCSGQTLTLWNPERTKECRDLLVTPLVKGDISFYLKRYYATQLPGVRLYRLTLNPDGTFSYNPETDLIDYKCDSEALKDSPSWSGLQTVNVGDSYSHIGIWLDNVYIDEIGATSAMLPERREISLGSVSHMEGFSTNVKADADGKITIGARIPVTNKGNVTLTEGSQDATIDFVQVVTSSPYAYNVLKTIPLPTLAPGESATVDAMVTCDVPEGLTASSSGQVRFRADFVENISGTTKSGYWYDITPYAAIMAIRYGNTNIDTSKVYDFGVFRGSRSQTFTLRNIGGAPMTVTSADIPEGLTLDVEFPLVIESGEEMPVNLTIGNNPGHVSGEVVFNYEGLVSANTIKVAGEVVAEDSFFADFEAADSMDDWYIPALSGNYWKRAEYSSSEINASKLDKTINGYRLENGINGKPVPVFSRLLTFEEGDQLVFYAAKRTNYGSDVQVTVQYSSDRANWNDLCKISIDSEDENFKFPSAQNELRRYSVTMPAGDWYVAFNAGYVILDNIYGGRVKEVAFDVVSESANVSAKPTVNHLLSYTTAFRNIGSSEITADSQTVTLLANGKAVATTEAVAMAPGQEVEYTLAYTPHTAGEVTLQAILAVEEYAAKSPEAKINIAEEAALTSAMIGTQTTTSGTVPLRLNYNNSKSEFVYTAEDLASLEGTRILSLSYPYYKTNDDHSAELLRIWLQNTDQAAPGDDFTNVEEMTLVYSAENFVFPKAGSSTELVDLEFRLLQPFEYSGQNLRLVIESLSGTYKAAYFGLDKSDSDRKTLYRAIDNRDSYLSSTTVSKEAGFPVINIFTEKDVPAVNGKVVDADQNPVEGAVLTARSGEVIYQTVSDAEGIWSMTIFQNTLDYTLTVTHPDYDELTVPLRLDQENVITLAAIEYEPSDFSIIVSAVTEADVTGLTVTLEGEASGFVFDPVKVNSQGVARFTTVPQGIYTLTVDGSPLGLEIYENKEVEHRYNDSFTVVLNEAVRTPYALKVEQRHDPFTGKDTAVVSWNRETDYFFDDFESYEPFAINFAPWTGHDGDLEPAAEIYGDYPNRGIRQYATIFNALTIDPPVYYEYPVMRPYSGKQYAAFVRTKSGNANNDWLISPRLTIGVDNVVSFMAKAADATPERFTVAVSETGTDPADFVQLTPGNYQTVDYRNWQNVVYSLARYEGKEVYVAVRCLSQNAFMLMVDDFYVGPEERPARVKRVGRRSAANPNETFTVTLDGVEVATTEDYSIVLDNLSAGEHTVGIRANYLTTSSDPAETTFSVDGPESYASICINVSADDTLPADGLAVNLLDKTSGKAVSIPVDSDKKASAASMPKGEYLVNMEVDNFEIHNSELILDADKTIEIALTEIIEAPFNVLHEIEQRGDFYDVTLWWNRDLGFTEGFESYPDFTQNIGDWTVYDVDLMPTYAMSVNGTVLTVPESRGKIGAMVFNPAATRPVSAAEDGYFIAPEGDKYVMFSSAESAESDDWLISPDVRIGEGYVLRFTAKSYDKSFPGNFEICTVKDTDFNEAEVIDAITLDNQWTRYEVDLSAYEGENIGIGFHHITRDGWISFLDDVYVGPAEERSARPLNPNCSYDIFVDGDKVANTSQTSHKLESIEAGTHTIGLQSIYNSGKKSELTEIKISIVTGVESIMADDSNWVYYTTDGLNISVDRLQPGINIRTHGTTTEKIIIT